MSSYENKITPVIAAIKHNDRRVNIPTSELSDFMSQETTVNTLIYPRDPSLDPQLVWKGKDQQNQNDLEIPIVPIYIQEKVSPQIIIENLRSPRPSSDQQLSLFNDFDGIGFEQMVDFYKYEQNWSNRLILGDSLLVMASLAQKENLRGRVQMLYFDPPYGIKFGSNWQVSALKRDVKDGKFEDITRQPEQIKAFRDTWALGIHSYLFYLRDRLVVARDLLTESGSLFVQIGSENVHLIRSLLDEVFGSENFIAEIVVQKTGSQSGDFLQSINDYICWYAKDREQAKFRPLFNSRKEDNESDFSADPLTSAGETTGSTFDFYVQGKKFHPGKGSHWKTNRDGMERLLKANRIVPLKEQIRFKRFWNDFPVKPFSNIWTGLGGAADITYVVQTNTKIVERCILMTTDPGDLVLDPTCGSGTTAYVAEHWGRRWITVDTSRVALTLARTRLITAKYPYFYLSDSSDGIKKTAELTGQIPLTTSFTEDIKKGFIYKRVPHVMLSSISSNQEIDSIYEDYYSQINTIRLELNDILNQTLEDWQLPQQVDINWPDHAKELYKRWQQLKQAYQRDIDLSIVRNSNTETLYDQPYEDTKRVRVTGPFTVESLSPHRVIAADIEQPASNQEGQLTTSVHFEARILEALKKAGVQNTVKSERLKFDSLEPFAGRFIHAVGEYNENNQIRRVAVSIGPEYGTVGKEIIRDSANEAVKGLGHHLLIVCGFAFDPDITEEPIYYGKLKVLPVRMNPELLIVGDEKDKSLLKSTGSGNLFMVFGEPDILREKDPSTNQITITIRGLDIYDPTTGEIRSNSTNDIACWFIDTNYNGEAFFVRHAYFTGDKQTYDKLKKALKAEIDEDAWASLYSVISRPFDPPATGRIAIKVINNYGDEVLKVYNI